jgi:hypothetical protein
MTPFSLQLIRHFIQPRVRLVFAAFHRELAIGTNEVICPKQCTYIGKIWVQYVDVKQASL